MERRPNPFDRGDAEAAEYDAWYDTPSGRAVVLVEEECVRELIADAGHPWIEVGTGTGRFGGDLGADAGLDAARAMLGIAARRLPAAVLGAAEALPLRDASAGAVLAATVFEFLGDPATALREIARVLRPGGRLVVGFFPQGGPWAAAYREHGRDPGSPFHGARFFTVEELEALGATAGLYRDGARSAFLEGLDPAASAAADGADPRAGFVALALTKRAEMGDTR